MGRSTRSEHYNPAYFDSNNECKKHGRYKCDDCYEAQNSPVALSTIVASNQDTNSFQAKKAEENFTKSVDFVKIALDMDDAKMDDVKVKDLPKMVVEAQDKITVGKMKKVLKGEAISSPGIIQTFVEWIKYKFSLS